MYSLTGHSVKSKKNMFALIIGIDDYANCRKLCGAVADAKAVKEYLEGVLRVPEDHIRTLFDHNATRDAIIEAFQDLRSNERIKEGDPIVIFYAGHGAELPAPTLWAPWGAEIRIQSLVPQDCRDSNILPIPDRTIGALIWDISKAKGNNIVSALPHPVHLFPDRDVQSIIFDCCHSASGTRVNNEAYAPRTVHLDFDIPADLDWEIWTGRFGKVGTNFAHHGLQSHVLLAACGEKEFAYEYEGRGQFTTALLEMLNSSAIDELTYSEVIERIHLNKYEYSSFYGGCDIDSIQSISGRALSAKGSTNIVSYLMREYLLADRSVTLFVLTVVVNMSLEPVWRKAFPQASSSPCITIKNDLLIL